MRQIKKSLNLVKIIKKFNYEIPFKVDAKTKKSLIKKLEVSEKTLQKYLTELRKLQIDELDQLVKETKEINSLKNLCVKLRKENNSIFNIRIKAMTKFNKHFSRSQITDILKVEERKNKKPQT